MFLAMKFRANHGIPDSDDIAFLLAVCNVKSLDDVQKIYERYQAQDVISRARRPVSNTVSVNRQAYSHRWFSSEYPTEIRKVDDSIPSLATTPEHYLLHYLMRTALGAVQISV